jgi:hypothetical protein
MSVDSDSCDLDRHSGLPHVAIAELDAFLTGAIEDDDRICHIFHRVV